MFNYILNTNSPAISNIKNCTLDKIKLSGENFTTLNWNEFSITKLICLNSTSYNIETVDFLNITFKDISYKLIKTPLSIKYYKVALLAADGYPLYENGEIVESSCFKSFKILPNPEGSCLSGRKLLVNGQLDLKIVYTENDLEQSVHTINLSIPFKNYIVIYPKFLDTPNEKTNITVIDPNNPALSQVIEGFYFSSDIDLKVDLAESFNLKICVEDSFVKLIDNNSLFISISIFTSALPINYN